MGTPTPLVRDGDVEGHDPPPATAGSAAIDPEELPEDETAGGLRRADDAQRQGAGMTPGEAAQEVMTEAPLD